MAPSMSQNYEEILIQHFGLDKLTKAYHDLSERYRLKKRNAGLRSDAEAAAYAIARMPATISVLKSALSKIDAFNVEMPKKIVDLGSGAGATYHVMREKFSDTEILCVEHDPHMLKILNLSNISAQKNSIMDHAIQKADWITLSYVLGELKPEQIKSLIKKVADSKPNLILITAPGTPNDYHDLMTARSLLIEAGYFIMAPCPHEMICPLTQNPNDWCHFSVRFDRSKAHKIIKGGTLPYEDEKYCYLVATLKKAPSKNVIIKAPQKHKGHVVFDICKSDGSHQKTIFSKKDHDYKLMKKSTWGDFVS
jgi:ribosomal protein RSM22 (predicted rRNA methylase)